MHEFAKMKVQTRIWIMEFEPIPGGVEIIGIFRDDSDHPMRGDQCWIYETAPDGLVHSIVVGPYHTATLVPDKPNMRKLAVLNPKAMKDYMMTRPKQDPSSAPKTHAAQRVKVEPEERRRSADPLPMEVDENNIPARYADLPKEEALRRWRNCVASKKSRMKKGG